MSFIVDEQNITDTLREKQGIQVDLFFSKIANRSSTAGYSNGSNLVINGNTRPI